MKKADLNALEKTLAHLSVDLKQHLAGCRTKWVPLRPFKCPSQTALEEAGVEGKRTIRFEVGYQNGGLHGV